MRRHLSENKLLFVKIVITVLYVHLWSSCVSINNRLTFTEHYISFVENITTNTVHLWQIVTYGRTTRRVASVNILPLVTSVNDCFHAFSFPTERQKRSQFIKILTVSICIICFTYAKKHPQLFRISSVQVLRKLIKIYYKSHFLAQTVFVLFAKSSHDTFTLRNIVLRYIVRYIYCDGTLEGFFANEGFHVFHVILLYIYINCKYTKIDTAFIFIS